MFFSFGYHVFEMLILLLFGVGSGRSILAITGRGKELPNAKAIPGRNVFSLSKSLKVTLAEMEEMIFKSSG